MEGGSCAAVLEESSTWTVLQQRSCEDHIADCSCGWNSEITTRSRAQVTTASVIGDRLTHGRQVLGYSDN